MNGGKWRAGIEKNMAVLQEVLMRRVPIEQASECARNILSAMMEKGAETPVTYADRCEWLTVVQTAVEYRAAHPQTYGAAWGELTGRQQTGLAALACAAVFYPDSGLNGEEA